MSRRVMLKFRKKSMGGSSTDGEPVLVNLDAIVAIDLGGEFTTYRRIITGNGNYFDVSDSAAAIENVLGDIIMEVRERE